MNASVHVSQGAALRHRAMPRAITLMTCRLLELAFSTFGTLIRSPSHALPSLPTRPPSSPPYLAVINEIKLSCETSQRRQQCPPPWDRLFQRSDVLWIVYADVGSPYQCTPVLLDCCSDPAPACLLS